MAARLTTTQWSQVLAARDGSETEARHALEGLCRTYWLPLYAYVRSLGNDEDRAEDLTQGFFTYLLEKDILQSVERSKGRFRSFLLASIKHYIAHDYRSHRALKRGGGIAPLSLDTPSAEDLLAPRAIEEMTPEQVFEHRWGLTTLERALDRLRSEWEGRDRGEVFTRLEPHLTGREPRVPFQQISEELGMSANATRGAMHRLRQRYGQLIREEIADTLAEVSDVDDEVKYLLGVIKPWTSD